MNPRALSPHFVATLVVAASCVTTSAVKTDAPARNALVVAGQAVPREALLPERNDFAVPAGVAVLHYHGSGGWGIQWGDVYLLAAPYFSNHSLATLLGSRVSTLPLVVPNLAEVRAGFVNTPVAKTQVVLIGHGHVDHAGDVPAYFEPELIAGQPTLFADRSTVNELGPVTARFGCVAVVDYTDPQAATTKCPTNRVRITPIHHAHAPHLNLLGLDVAAFGGIVKAPLPAAPSRADDYRLGNTWAYLIDLLDERGRVVFRIHYVDAAGSPPHGLAPAAVNAERPVDVHIGCVPGFEQSDDYPEAVLEYHHAKYVLAAHWEDFFQPRRAPLAPLRNVLDAKALNRFVGRVEQAFAQGHATTLTPLNKSAAACGTRGCGPHGPGWSLPVPGETFHFATDVAL